MPRVTTTKNGFRVEDITFRNARKQSQILEEIGDDSEDTNNRGVSVPVSFTPEQVIKFYKDMSARTDNVAESKIYAITITFIEEALALKKEVTALRSKLEVYQRVNEDTTFEEDIQE